MISNKQYFVGYGNTYHDKKNNKDSENLSYFSCAIVPLLYISYSLN